MSFPADPWAGFRKPGFPVPPGTSQVGPRQVSTTVADAPLAGGGMTLDALMARQKQLAGQQTPMTAMQSPMQGIAYALEKGLAGWQEGRAAKDVATGQSAVANALQTMGEHGELTPKGKAALAQYDPDTFLALWKSQQKQFGPVITGDAAKALGLDPTRQYQQNLSTGQYDPIGGQGQNIQVGPAADEATLSKKFSEGEAGIWKDYITAGNQASQIVSSMDMIDQLSAVAPQGGLTGALAEMFPSFTSAGAAWKATISDLIPKLRVPGSGSQSDADLDNIRAAMPRLGNNTAANQLISSFMRKKAVQNVKRGQIVSQWANSDRSPEATTRARDALNAIDTETLMTPDLQRLIQKVVDEGGGGGGGDPSVPPDEAGSGPSHKGGGGPDAGTGGGAEKPPKKDPFEDKYGI